MPDPSIERIAGQLSEGERMRLLAGRLDWRDEDWQDHCGDVGCPFCDGEIPWPEPGRLPPAEAAVREYLAKQEQPQ